MNFMSRYKQDNQLIKPDPVFIESLICDLQEYRLSVKPKRMSRWAAMAASAAAVCLIMVGAAVVYTMFYGWTPYPDNVGGEYQSEMYFETTQTPEDNQDLYDVNIFANVNCPVADFDDAGYYREESAKIPAGDLGNLNENENFGGGADYAEVAPAEPALAQSGEIADDSYDSTRAISTDSANSAVDSDESGDYDIIEKMLNVIKFIAEVVSNG